MSEFLKNKICPYCQSKFKGNSETVLCPECNISHHKECWEENKGCTTYGCRNNPNTLKSADTDIPRQVEVLSPSCGDVLQNTGETSQKFEEEYRKKYAEKVSFKRKKLLAIGFSGLVLTALIVTSVYFIVIKINNYFSNEEIKMKELVLHWKEAYETRNINKYKECLDNEYVFYEKDGKSVNYKEKIKRVSATFENYKYIKINLSDLKFSIEPLSVKYAYVTFHQEYESDKYKESSNKTLKLYRGTDTGNQWKIFREYVE